MAISKNRLYLLVTAISILGVIWLSYHFISENSVSVCLFKNITGIPCPSCGSTRAIILLGHGKIIEAILVNPLGIIIAAIMVVAPFWLLSDIVMQKNSFYNVYLKFELLFQRPIVRNSFIILILVNWYWNIIKHL